MTNHSSSSTSTSKINFSTLYRKFKKKVVRHFLLAALWTAWNIVLFGAIVELFQKKQISSDYDYSEILIPKKIREWGWFRKIGKISQGRFILIGLALVVGYALLYYWNSVWEEELRVKGRNYTENVVLDKFRSLTFKEKQAQKDKVNKLVETDSWEIGHYWEHLPNHIFHNGLKIIGLFFFHWDKISQMNGRSVLFSLFWLGLINVIIYFFTRKVLKNEERYKKRLDKEWAIFNKERNNITLIESMGLTSEYRTRQQEINKANEKLCLKFSRTKSLSKTIPNNFLMELFPFLLLGLNSSSFNGAFLVVFWWIFSEFASIFRCLWEYADYKTSLSRINNFLTLPEKNDNLTGIKLDPQLTLQAVQFENVSFRYNQSEKWVLRHYQKTFTNEKVNHLWGANGTGKSTILYLLLGQLTPQEGKIILVLSNGRTYDLRQINLDHWRKNHLTYYAHETLVEKGSTGQKQLTNLEQVLTQRETSQIFCFDEADNALDVKNQSEFQIKLQNLVKKGKLVIYIKH